MRLGGKLFLLAAAGILSTTTTAKDLEYYQSHLEQARAILDQCHTSFKAALESGDQELLESIQSNESCKSAEQVVLEDEQRASQKDLSQKN